ncbi:MAG: ABC transporter ATP-binding protein [Lacrimispora sp.]
MALIEVKNLKYRYPHTENLALDGIEFAVEKGQFIGIVGENKAGKSTLCQAFAGLVPTMFRGAYGGKLLINGAEAAQTPIAELCQTVGLVFQNPFNQLSGAKETVFEEIAFGLQNLGVPREEIYERVEKNLKLLDIEEYRDRNPFDLSGGQTQRVAIASILAMEPEVIVLDEPTSQLDPQGSEEVFRVVEKLAKAGITIIMVEHKMEKMASYCDKILLLHQGKQVAYDTPERIFSRDDLEELGVKPPVYTQVCKALGVCRKDGEEKLYPVTLEQTQSLRNQFPETLSGRLSAKEEKDEGAQEIFRMEHLGFHYLPGVPVIDDLTLCLDNRPTAIIGQNGAGKTTLVKLLKGLLKPQDGNILFEDEDMSKKTVAQLAGRVGYVFQNPDDQIFKEVLDEVMVGPLNIGMSRRKQKDGPRKLLR